MIKTFDLNLTREDLEGVVMTSLIGQMLDIRKLELTADQSLKYLEILAKVPQRLSWIQ